jgi:hypothetical protein
MITSLVRAAFRLISSIYDQGIAIALQNADVRHQDSVEASASPQLVTVSKRYAFLNEFATLFSGSSLTFFFCFLKSL